MKTNVNRAITAEKKSILVMTLLVALVLFGCKESPYIPNPGTADSRIPDTIPVIVDPDASPDPEEAVIPEGTITVYEAIKIGKKLAPGSTSEQTYFIKGWVRNFDEKERAKADFEEKFKQYGNDYVHLSAREDGAGTKDFYCYRILGKYGAPFPDHDALQLGDFVVVKCKIQNYNGIIESSGTCATYSSTNEHFNEVFPPFPGCPEPGEGEISVNRAQEICDSIGQGKTTSGTYKIRGVVVSVSTPEADVKQYGNMTFNISSDGDVAATCYRLKGKNNARFNSIDQLQVGDTVLVNAKIQNYYGTCEPTQGYVMESTNPNF
jgi:hypothetical protein